MKEIPDKIVAVLNTDEGFEMLMQKYIDQGGNKQLAYDLSVREVHNYFPKWKAHSSYASWYTCEQKRKTKTK